MLNSSLSTAAGDCTAKSHGVSLVYVHAPASVLCYGDCPGLGAHRTSRSVVAQYTALVDAHVPRLAACLGDRHELVRRQALALLANLLQKVPGVPAQSVGPSVTDRA